MNFEFYQFIKPTEIPPKQFRSFLTLLRRTWSTGRPTINMNRGFLRMCVPQQSINTNDTDIQRAAWKSDPAFSCSLCRIKIKVKLIHFP